MTGPEVIERVARAMEPRAFETYDRGATVQNFLAEAAFLNAEKVVKRARKKAGIAIAAFLAATREPSESMIQGGAETRMTMRIRNAAMAGSIGRWPARDCWETMHAVLARELGAGDG